ncbi:MAG: radical SAM protein [Candidatus Omnitrophica bacterium]|nr:radical SAM protein [Candidatus Omnitrophota bacterium]MBU1523190.1 radical SAM protein [Candidatus Omnitrophota bacterium]
MQSEPYVVRQDISKTSLWKDTKPLLGRLDMEITERCNNNCLHCCINLPADDLEAKKKELATDEIKGILKEVVSLGCMSVRFTGGEPLLREDFQELYIFARKSGLKVLIFTNATLLTPQLADLFCHIPPLEKIEVTVYGMKKESYESATRTPGSFEDGWRGINLLLEKKIPFVVKSALLPSNKNEIEEFEAWASTISWMDNKPPSYSMFFDLRCRRDCADKNQLIKSLRLSAEGGLKILARRKDEYIKEMKEFCAKFMRPSGDKLFSCGAGCGGGCVDAYGNFQLCMMLRHPETVYNLKQGSLKDALENFFPQIRQAKASNPTYLNRCARCFLKGLCEQCPTKSWSEHGNLDTPVEYLCEIAHAQARFLRLLNEDEKAWQVEDWEDRIRDFSAVSRDT